MLLIQNYTLNPVFSQLKNKRLFKTFRQLNLFLEREFTMIT